MKFLQRHVPVTLLAIIALTACTKIDTTRLGQGLIPEVDNINTFDTLMQVVANNDLPTDSTRLRLSDDHVVGAIYNDERFGDSKATLFFEFKPSNYPVGRTDTIQAFDSAVMVLKFVGIYGSETAPVDLNLYELGEPIARDSLLQPSYQLNAQFNINRSRLWGSKTITAKQLGDTIKLKRGDSVVRRVVNQLRIPVRKDYAEAIFRDTAKALKSDSLFQTILNGFALEVQNQAKSLLYFRLLNEESGLEFYYRTKRVAATTIDTTSERWGAVATSGHAVRFERFRAGSEFSSFSVPDPVNGHSQVYLQSSPGTAAKVSIPGLSKLTNRVIHRAELRITELGGSAGAGTIYTPPAALLLDVKEKDSFYTGIPYDLSPLQPYFCSPPNGIDFEYYGGIGRKEVVGGSTVTIYRFNLSRYIQNVISQGEPIKELRLSAPFYTVYRDCRNIVPGFGSTVFLYQLGNTILNPVGRGQVRVAGGNFPNANLRMQLRIIYSKL